VLIASLDAAIAKVNAVITGGNGLIVASIGSFVEAILGIAGRNPLNTETIPIIAGLG
jgi:hypothetical protein